MSRVDVVISTTCHLRSKFLSCRHSVARTIPEGVTVQIVLDHNNRGKRGILNAIFGAQPRDFIYLHDDMVVDGDWYGKFVYEVKRHPGAGILVANLEYPENRTSFQAMMGGCYFQKAAIDQVGKLKRVTEWDKDYIQRMAAAGFGVKWVPVLIVHNRKADKK